MHCEQPTCAEVCPADAIKRTGDGVVQSARKPTMHRVRQLCRRVPVWRARALRRPQDHDEVRHVLRPVERRQEADVCDGVPEPGALLRHARTDRAAAAAVGTREHIPVRQSDHHDAGVRDGAAQAGEPRAPRRRRCRDGRAASEPRGVAEGREYTRTRRRTWRHSKPIRSPRSRCSDGDVRRDPRAAIDPAINSPGPRRADRHGSGKPLRAIVRPGADHHRPGLRAGRFAARLAAGLPDRLAAGSVRRAPRLHEVHGAHERRVHRRPAVDRARRTGIASAAANRRSSALRRSTTSPLAAP